MLTMLIYWVEGQYYKEKHRNFSRSCIVIGIEEILIKLSTWSCLEIRM